jgi:hypothetical protein
MTKIEQKVREHPALPCLLFLRIIFASRIRIQPAKINLYP